MDRSVFLLAAGRDDDCKFCCKNLRYSTSAYSKSIGMIGSLPSTISLNLLQPHHHLTGKFSHRPWVFLKFFFKSSNVNCAWRWLLLNNYSNWECSTRFLLTLHIHICHHIHQYTSYIRSLIIRHLVAAVYKLEDF